MLCFPSRNKELTSLCSLWSLGFLEDIYYWAVDQCRGLMRALTFTQLHEGNPCLPSQPCLPPHPQREGGRGRALWRAGGRSSPAQHSKAQPSWLHLQTASRRNEHLPHKEQVSNQPADSHPWQTQERKWQEVGTKVVFIICGGMSMRNYRAVRHPPLQWGPMVTFQLHSLGLHLHGPAPQHTSCPGMRIEQVRGT